MIPQNALNPAWSSFANLSGASGAGSSTGAQAAANPTNATNAAEAQAYMDAGLKLLGEHRYSEALEVFREGFRLYPDRNFILNEASTLLSAGRYAEAVLAYDRYLADPNPARADEARAAQERARAKLGNTEASITGVAESQRLNDVGAKAFKEGRYEEALDAFERAAALNPMASLEYNQAACLEKLGRPYAAADQYESYVVHNPGADDAQKVLEKIGALRKAADAAPITAAGAAGGQEWMSKGLKLLREGRYDEAAEAFRAGFRTYPDERLILDEAAALLRGGRYSEADLAYQRYLGNPNAPRADEARAAQQQARAAVGGHEANAADLPAAQREFARGEELYAAGRYADALEHFDKSYTLQAQPETLYNRAACLDQLGRREEAAKLYREYARTAPTAPDADRVRQHANDLHAKAVALAGGALNRGIAAFGERRFRDAALAYREAREHVPTPDATFRVAKSLDKAGETAEAIREYQRYLNEAPDAKDAGEVRTRIRELQAANGNELMQPE